MSQSVVTHPPYRLTSLVGVGLGALQTVRAARLADVDHVREHAGRMQLRQLRWLLHRASATEFGQEHMFGKAVGLAGREMLRAYRDLVPIADWYAFKDQIARMREDAEPDVLWPGLVRDFCQTSGTTAGDKFIPVTEEMKKSNFKAARDIFTHAMNFGISLPGIMGGKCLFLGGSTAMTVSDKGVRTGDLSGIAATQIHWPLSRIYSPGSGIALMDNWTDKIDAMARHTIDQDVRMVSGMPSWMLVLIERLFEVARERGQYVSTLKEIWPNFQLFVHGGVKYGPFDARMRQMWSGGTEDIPYRLELYPASEGFVAIQDQAHDPGMRLLTDHRNMFEFVPLEDIDRPDAPAFLCDEVEKGQKYVVVLSTCAGLWRYVLGDVVEFDTVPSLYEGNRLVRSGDGPPRVRVVGRHRHFINAFGENIIAEHIENAVERAARVLAVEVGEFTAAPVYSAQRRKAGLELILEIEQASAVQLEHFADEFDKAIKSQNVDYTTKRKSDLSMGPPIVTPVRMGAFHAWMASKGKLGGQHKCPRCANHRDIADEVRTIAGIGAMDSNSVQLELVAR
ncbi:MAG: GH3 auxin-responsive promoter family protein [Phycisphaeraceae bacterium]|nr:GH3 auxin-responsive promoter family protein [Phycisphaerales bacterium]MCB9860987.1 GH3 auxin-responsive promoter family protein [Phycisphaeraceae bacterium]